MAAADRSLAVKAHRFDTPGRVDLKVGIKSGSVRIETWDGSETLVELDSPDDDLVHEVQVDHQPSVDSHRVVIRVPVIDEHRFLRMFSRSSIDVHVKVPHQALADASTSSGAVTLSGSYREVRVNTASGDVEVGHVSGPASINTASGDIAVDSVSGLATIRTASGSVRCGHVDLGGDIKTASGDVRIDAVTDRITVTTGSGDIELGESDGCKLRSAAGDLRVGAVREGLVDLQTASGDIDVAVVSGALIAVDAESVIGDLSSEIDLSGSQPDTDSGTDGDREIELILRTVNGDIQVRRTSARATA
jgi:DUF4097 and DUF4098 domain-containing protein YvlB